MRKTVFLIMTLMLSIATVSSFANEAQERVYLTQILNTLDSIKPLILAGQKEQPKNVRIKFHYTRYHDNQGRIQNGLLEDINHIKQGIKEELNQVSVEPRVFQPIRGDYVDLKRSHS